MEIPWSTHVSACGVCNRILLYGDPGNQMDESTFFQGVVAFPETEFPETVPCIVAEKYRRAHAQKTKDLHGFATGIRTALETLCKEQGFKKGNLMKKINDLASAKQFPTFLTKAAHEIRLMGNAATHGDEGRPDPLLADALDKVFRMIVEYVHVAPHRLERLEEYLRHFEPEGLERLEEDLSREGRCT